MALTEQSVYDSINIRDTGHIELRRVDLVLRDGVPIGTPQYHRVTLAPGDDISAYPANVQAAAASVWTPESMASVTAAIVAQAQAESAIRASHGASIPTDTPPAVQRVKMGQARKALILKGISLADVDAILDQLPEPQRSLAKVDWEFEPYVERSNPLVLAVAAAKHLTDTQVDDLFTFADSLISGA